MQQFAAEFLRLHITQDISAQRTDGVRQGRHAKSRIKFLRDCAAAHDLALLQHQRFKSALGQIKRRDQRVMPTTNHGNFLSDGHASG